MKLYGNITLDVAGEEILERPGLPARARKAHPARKSMQPTVARRVDPEW